MTGTRTSATQSNSPLHNAETLLSSGFSVIPLSANKQAAIPWKAFQYRLPTSEELTSWFTASCYTNSAIITGRISRLIVLDIDQHERLIDFTRDCPDLLDTLIVQTKRGYHLYYRIPTDLHVPTQHADGVDLQGEGAYVVAPGSVIDGHTYTLMTTYGQQPCHIEERQITRLLRVMNRWNRQHSPLPSRQELASEEPPPEAAPTINLQSPSITSSELAALYQSAASRDGRNHTLFRLACLARDHGFSAQEVAATLAHLHAIENHSPTHQQEQYASRYREAQRTIASAFSRPPRPIQHRNSLGLPNNLREALFQQKLTIVVRVVEGLRLNGIVPGETITRGRAVELLRGVVGRDSVYAAFNAVLPGGEPVFSPSNSPQPPLHSVASESDAEKTPQCFVVSRKNPGKSTSQAQNPPHRPAETFITPTNQMLAARLNLPLSGISDPLELDDLKQAHITRQRYHELFLQRRPGEYPIGLFARRLGVTERTIRHYHQQNPAIRSEIRLQETPIAWWNVDTTIPEALPHGGFWLADEQGKRYPAKVGVAQWLLGKKKRVSLFRRLPNYWYVEGYRPEKSTRQAEQGRVAIRLDDDRPVTIIRVPVMPKRSAITATNDKPQPAASQARIGKAERVKPRRLASGKRKLKDPEAEACAQRVYQRINELSQGREGRISIRSTRRMVDQYGMWCVARAVGRIEKRENVYKPVGLLATMLRSENRSINVS